MKKILISLLLLTYAQCVFAADTANIKLRINGAVADNRYFFCEPGLGCMSILAAQRGKIYPLYHPIQLRNAYITNFQTFRVSAQVLPKSCTGKVSIGQTITIFGNLASGRNGKVNIKNVYCLIR